MAQNITSVIYKGWVGGHTHSLDPLGLMVYQRSGHMPSQTKLQGEARHLVTVMNIQEQLHILPY